MPTNGAQEAERSSALGRREQLLDQARHLRGDHTGGRALHQPGDDQPQRATGGARCRAAHGEQREPGDEHVTPTAGVPEPSRRYQQQAEGQRVTGEDPLQIGRAHVQPGLDGRDRDVDDADIQQRHEGRYEADRCGAPAAGRPGGVRPPGLRLGAHPSRIPGAGGDKL
jgi:hypothetical protein